MRMIQSLFGMCTIPFSIDHSPSALDSVVWTHSGMSVFSSDDSVLFRLPKESNLAALRRPTVMGPIIW